MPDRFFFAEPEIEPGLGQLGVCVLNRFQNAVLDDTTEAFVPLVTVQCDGARCVMCVGGVDENVRPGNAGRLLDFLHHRVEQIARQHQHVARNHGKLVTRRLFEHNRYGAKLSFLALGLDPVDHPAEDHRIIGFQVYGCRADAHVRRWQRR